MNCAGPVDESFTFEANKIALNRRRLLFILCCFATQVSVAQPQAAYAFTHYSMLNGFASNEVNQIVQDRTGYLWIATNNGLQRFDGVEYKTFQHHNGDASGFPNNNILSEWADKQGRLFLLFAGGYAGIFNPVTFTYKACAVKPRNPSSLQTELRFIPDEAGHLFLLLRSRELLQYIEAKNEFSATENMIPLKLEWRITTMSQQPGT